MSESTAIGGDAVLVADNLSKVFGKRRRKAMGVLAVDRVSFALVPGRALAIVGESGSGKSTVARLLVRIYAPSDGRVLVHGVELPRRLGRRRALRYRKSVQMIFQDPFASLNPVKTVEHHLIRPLKLHHRLTRQARRKRALELLTVVGLEPAEEVIKKFPHQLSGGQRQRVAFAAALAADPSVLIADEPTSMLDVSLRVGLLNLIDELKERRRLALLFITHDLASARYVADEIMVLYRGRMVEHGPAEELLRTPRHPYTQLLLSAAPDVHKSQVALPVREARSDVPAVGCPFEPRCPLAFARCRAEEPQSISVGNAHDVRCFAVETQESRGG
jgi:peptide/nickel transport system ATP-binding protein